MRVGVYIDRFFPQGSCVERTAGKLLSALVDRGFEVTLHARELSREGRASAFRTVAWPRVLRGRGIWHRRAEAACWGRRMLDGPWFDATLSLSSLVPATCMMLLGDPLVRRAAEEYGASTDLLTRLRLVAARNHPAVQRSLAMERRALRRSGTVLVASPAIGQWLSRRTGLPRRRTAAVDVWPPHVQVPQRERAEARARLRRVWRIADESPGILYAPADSLSDGATRVLASLREPALETARAVLLVAGSADYTLQRAAATLGVRERLRLVGATRHMGELLAASDVFVSPTRSTGWDGAAREALMAGLPVVTSSQTPLASDPRRREAVYVLPPQWDTADLAEVLATWRGPAPALTPDEKRLGAWMGVVAASLKPAAG